MRHQRWIIVAGVVLLVGVLGVLAYLLLRSAPEEATDLEEVRRLIEAGDYASAKSALLEQVAAEPDNAEAHFLLGLAHFSQAEYPEARTEFERALELDPSRASAVHHNLGALAFQTGNLDDAVVEFEKALEIDPNDSDSHYQLGATYLVKAIPVGSLDPDPVLLELARSEFDAALEQTPNKPEALVGIANIHLLKGDVPMAIEVLEPVVESNPNMREALFALGQSYATIGDREQALSTLKRFLATDPPDVYAQQAQDLIDQLEP